MTRGELPVDGSPLMLVQGMTGAIRLADPNPENTVTVTRILPIIAAPVLLTACPYDGTHPLGEPSVALYDAGMLGEWVPVNGSAESFDIKRLWIMPYDADEYVVVSSTACPIGGGRGYLAEVQGRKFLNIQHRGEKSTSYGIARVEMRGDRMEFRPVASLDSVGTSADLRDIFSRRVNESGFYDDSVTLRRTATVLPLQGDSALTLLNRACESEVDFDISDAVMEPATARAFTGTWRLTMASVDLDVTIAPKNARTLLARVLPPTGSEDDTTNIDIGSTRIGGRLFVQYAEEGKEHGGPSVTTIIGDTIVMRWLNASVDVPDALSLRALLSARGGDSSIYFWEPMRLVRKRR